MQYCNAGHNAPYTFSDGVKPLAVEPNLALGILPGKEFGEQETDMLFDDALFLYTDGISEAENAEHELFGEERMIRVLSVRRRSEKQLEAVRQAVDAFVGNAPQSDDKTMLFLHYLNPKLVLRNEISEISRLGPFVEAISRNAGLSTTEIMNINLALEEAVTNVVMYAYPEGEDGLVTVEAKRKVGALEFILSDSGKAFDPTVVPDADTTLGAEQRRIGGLGIFLVRKLMDEISYERRDGKNYLYMKKKI